MSSIVLGQYKDGTLLYQDHVTLGIGGMDFVKIKAQSHRLSPPFAEVPDGNEDAIWLDPNLVCRVEFMNRTKTGSIRQPVFKGLQLD